MDTDEGWTGETAEVGGGSRQATNRGVEPLGIELPVLGGAVDDLVAVGPTSLPIPRKICEKIWDNQFVNMQELRPSRLGAADPTWRDLVEVASRGKSSENV